MHVIKLGQLFWDGRSRYLEVIMMILLEILYNVGS